MMCSDLATSCENSRDTSNIVSIIIPVYNELKTIYAMHSIWRIWSAQPQVELIFVDGGSQDGSESLLTELGFKVIRSDKGRAAQMNLGAQHTQGSLLWFIHADTFFKTPELAVTHLLQRTARVMIEQKSCYFWGFTQVSIESTNASVRQKLCFFCIAVLINLRSSLTKVSTGDQCQFFSKALFDKLGGFAPIPLLEDVCIAKQARYHTKPLVLRIKARTSGRRWLQQGIIKTVILMWRIRFLYWQGVSPDKLQKMYTSER